MKHLPTTAPVHPSAPGIGRPSRRPTRLADAVLTLIALELTVATAYIHLGLGGLLFTLNGAGYLVLGAAYGLTAVPLAVVERFAWIPRLALGGYALLTIGAYVLSASWFSLGWITKGIEVAIVGLVAVDLLGRYGSAGGLVRAIGNSLRAGPTGGARHA